MNSCVRIEGDRPLCPRPRSAEDESLAGGDRGACPLRLQRVLLVLLFLSLPAVLCAQTGLVVTTTFLPPATVGVPYNAQVSASGGQPPYLWTASGLPSGLTMSSGGGISGTPEYAGSFGVTVTVRGTANTANFSGSARLSLFIADPLQITTSSPLPDYQAGLPNYFVAFNTTGGTPAITFSIADTAPPGLTLSETGELRGTPSAAGTFTFTVRAIDSAGRTATKQFQQTFTPAPAQLVVSRTQLSFSGAVGGDPPPPQVLQVTSVDGRPIGFNMQVTGANLGGLGLGGQPPWLNISPSNGVTPALLTISASPSGLPAGTNSARIRFTVARDATQQPIDVNITFVLTTVPPSLEVTPLVLTFPARQASPGIQQQNILVRNSGGGGPVSFSASVVNASPWLSISPASGQTTINVPSTIRVSVNTQGLGVGSYRDVVRVTGAGKTTDVVITLFVAPSGPILSVDVTGLRFPFRSGLGSSIVQNIRVLNQGDPTSTVNWTADVQMGADWLTLGTARGTASQGRPGVVPVSLSPGTTSLASGGRYALIRISDPAAQNSPQYVTAVLDVSPQSAPPLPELAPVNLVFVANAGGAQSQNTAFRLSASSVSPVAFQTSVVTDDGGTWLQASPSSGLVSTSSPVQISVAVNPSILGVGIYKGRVNVAMSGVIRSREVTLIVIPVGASPEPARAATGCTASRLAMTQGGLTDNFSSPAGWPASLILQLNDNCGSPVTNGSVTASFSNGDPPLALASDRQTGIYSATFQPTKTTDQLVVTVRASASTYATETTQIAGAITPNTAPVLAKGGTLHNLNPVIGGALAPGTVSQVFGTGMAASTTSPGVIPLQTSFGGTSMIVGGLEAPLYYVSSGQLTVQIPNELTPNRQYAVIVSANGALTLPDSIDVVSVQPGVAQFTNGDLIAQHPDYSLVDAAHPAQPGEYLIMYLAGLGATTPAVKSGSPAPATSLSPANVQPTVTVDGVNASTVYAGLTPGGIGLYQINFQVPDSARNGSLEVVVKQGGVTANVTKLPVQRQ